MADLKAFIVQQEDDGAGGVVYAKTNAQARREGACQYGDGDFHSVTCRRAPEFDALRGNPRAIQEALFAKGWWFDNGHERLSGDDEPFVTKDGIAYRNWCAWLAERESEILRHARDSRIRRDWLDKLWSRWWFADAIRIHVEPSGNVDARIDLPYLRDGVRMLEREGCQHTVTLRDLPTYQQAYRINQDAEAEATDA